MKVAQNVSPEYRKEICLRLGDLRAETSHMSKQKENIKNSVETIFMKLVGMFVSMISRLSFKLGHIGSKTRVADQVIANLLRISSTFKMNPQTTQLF